MNLTEAAKYDKLAADQNSEVAQFHACVCLANGQGVPADHIEVVK
jgi:TPR repeat protein